MQRKNAIAFICLSFLLLLAACKMEDAEVEDQEVSAEVETSTINAEPVEVELTNFAEEVGLTLEAPPSEVETVLPLRGEIAEADQLNSDYLWVIVRKTESIEEIDRREFEHYVQIEDGQFAANLNLHHGEGEYRVTVRVPSNDATEDELFYDAAIFKVKNLDKSIARDVEYTSYGLEKGLQLADSIKGWNEASKTIQLEGTVNDNYEAMMLLAEVKKDGDKNKVTIPIYNGTFKGEIPLYYGEGSHMIKIQLYSDNEKDREGTYYDSAIFYVNNDSAKIFPEITQYGPYIESGLTLEQPNWNIDIEQNSIEYPIKGTIDKNAPRADSVSHVIVKMQHKEERKDEATYYFPVKDYAFEGTAHFRFGPGEYEVTIFIPDEEQKRKNEFHFTAALQIKHEVTGIKDERDLLPSRGVESDHATILKQAKELTDGLTTEREKAKAIYEFVAKHVAYDVDKFKQDIFHPDDSALSTLDSGSGICQDYAFLTLALLRSIDIESRYVQGHAGGRHAWVEAKVDDEWIEMDPTWGAGYVDRNEFHFQYNEDYFDPDPDFLAETHRRSGLLY